MRVAFSEKGKRYSKAELVRLDLEKLQHICKEIGLSDEITSYRPPRPPSRTLGFRTSIKSHNYRSYHVNKTKYKHKLISLILKFQ